MPHKEDLKKEITQNYRRLQLLKEQKARQGINTDPAVITEIEDIEIALKELQAELEGLGSLVKPDTDELSSKEQHYQAALDWAKNGREVSLSKFDLSGADLQTVDLAGAQLSFANLSESNLLLANLSETDMRLANMQKANLIQANLKGAQLQRADLSFAWLKDTEIDGTTQIDDKWRLVWQIVNRGAENRDLRGANLIRANLFRVNLSNANLSRANLILQRNVEHG